MKTKGIADLSHVDRHHLHTVLTDGEISVTKVQSKHERSKCLKYVHNSVLMCGLLSEALGNSKLPVIIGAPPPADSGHAKAQQMYVNGTIDYKGPPRLLPSKVATRIKRGVGVVSKPKAMGHNVIAIRHIAFSKATKDDPIIISSDNSSRSTKIKVAMKKKKSKYILLSDLSGDEAVAMINPTEEADVGPYQEPGPTLKRKANKLLTTCPTKKPAMMAAKKGKQRTSSCALNEEELSSDSDFPDRLMTQGMYLYSTHDTVITNDTSVPARLGDEAPSSEPDHCGSASKLVSLVYSTYTDIHPYRERGFRPVLGFDHSRCAPK